MNVGSWKLLMQFGLLILGGSIGSFMNVVVYRLPAAGKGIAWPGSHCPVCQHDIRWHDNIPILSWFWLHGRCRDCGASFSIRYAVVEILVALLFVWIGTVEGLSGATNVPWGSSEEPVAGEAFGTWQSWGMSAYHLCLICTSICVVLIDDDGNRVPVRLLVFGLVVGLIAPIFFADLRPMHVASDLTAENCLRASTSLGLADGVAGVLMGCLAGWLAGRFGRGQGGWTRWSYLAGGMLVGSYLGWQATVAIALGAWLVQIHVKMLFRHARPWFSSWFFYVVVGVFLWILNWRTIVDEYF